MWASFKSRDLIFKNIKFQVKASIFTWKQQTEPQLLPQMYKPYCFCED